MRHQATQHGYSLIEVLIAVAVLMVAIVAPMTIAVKSIQSSQYSMEQNTAVFLAQEGISLIEMYRNAAAMENFNANTRNFWDWTSVFAECETAQGCNFDARDPYDLQASDVVSCDAEGEACRLYYSPEWGRSPYRVGETTGEATQFIRRVIVDELDDSLIRVRVVVEWGSNFLGQDQSVSVTSTYYNVYGAF